MGTSIDMLRIAEEIIERSPSIALRATRKSAQWSTSFITRNISIYGYDSNDFLSGKLNWIDIVHPDDKDDLVNLINGFEEMGNDQYNIIYRIVRADGGHVWISDNSHVIRDADGVLQHTDCIISDYTETKEHLERIGENLRMQAVLNEILQGLHNSDLDEAIHIILEKSGAFLDIGRVILFQNTPGDQSSRAIHEWCNKGVPSLIEQGDYSIHYANDLPGISSDLLQYGSRIVNYGEIPPACAVTFENDGVTAAALYAINIQDEPFGFLTFQECGKERRWTRDVVRFLDNVSRLIAPVIFRQRNEHLIQALAMTDQLTGLNNRHHLEIRLGRSIAKAREMGRSGYLMFIDMDDFKIINDAYGHDYGDAILREVSAFLKTHFTDIDNIFRFGGDEFVILLEPGSNHDIYGIISGLLQRAQLPWSVIDRAFYCTLSIGVVRFPEGQEDSREIIKNADIAMYQAKKMGKNNYVFYTSTLDNDSVARAEMETAMRASIENGFEGFEVHYQPLVDTDRKVIGAEALVRWTIAGKRLSPVQFVPLAEYLGLIIPIGEFVLRSAVQTCNRINEIDPEFFVSVNVSIRQFKQLEFMERIIPILEEEGIAFDNVMLEITEGMAIHDMQRMKMLAAALRSKGIRVAMDDFGTGYSSLGNMRDLPMDVVKIDRAFIHDVTTDNYSKSFIRFITDLVHSMGRKVCIEGVETAGQFRYCRECGADYVQGFHLWRPMPAMELLEVMAEQETTGKDRRRIG